MDVIDEIEKEAARTDIPSFNVGDNVDVSLKVVDGEREHIQVFSGTVIARKGSGVRETFTVRKVVQGEGVERVFPLCSPNLAGLKIVRKGKTKRSKLYYLRDRVGKATKVKEARMTGEEDIVPAAPAEELEAEAEPAEGDDQQEESSSETKEE